MAVACPVDLDTQFLRKEVSTLYSRVVNQAGGAFHFHRGPAYAAEFLGYDPQEVATLPAETTRAFAGIANPHLIAPISAGETVLDVGSGAGMDLLLAARKVGPRGRAIGVDMTDAMVELARASARSLGLNQAEIRKGDATALPVESASVDVVISNGVLNLVPEKERAFDEIVRVLKPGGRLQLGDILLDVELSEDTRRNIDLWTG
jgi:arsenite methyltransferase